MEKNRLKWFEHLKRMEKGMTTTKNVKPFPNGGALI